MAAEKYHPLSEEMAKSSAMAAENEYQHSWQYSEWRQNVIKRDGISQKCENGESGPKLIS